MHISIQIFLYDFTLSNYNTITPLLSNTSVLILLYFLPNYVDWKSTILQTCIHMYPFYTPTQLPTYCLRLANLTSYCFTRDNKATSLVGLNFPLRTIVKWTNQNIEFRFTQSVIQKLLHMFFITFIILTQRFVFLEWLGMFPTLAFNANSDTVYDLVKAEVVKKVSNFYTLGKFINIH